MTIEYYIAELMTVLGNLVYSQDNKVSPRFIESMFPEWKQQAIFIAYHGHRGDRFVRPRMANKFINAQNFVKTRTAYDINIQEEGADYVNFIIEPAVNISSLYNGFAFAGDKLSSLPFTQLTNPNSYYTHKTAGLIDNNKVYFYISSNNIQAYGNTQIREISFNYIPIDVMNVEVWNTTTNTYALFDPEVDDYPVSPDVWSIMTELALNELTPPNMRPADYTNNGTPPLEKQANG